MARTFRVSVRREGADTVATADDGTNSRAADRDQALAGLRTALGTKYDLPGSEIELELSSWAFGVWCVFAVLALVVTIAVGVGLVTAEQALDSGQLKIVAVVFVVDLVLALTWFKVRRA